MTTAVTSAAFVFLPVSPCDAAVPVPDSEPHETFLPTATSASVYRPSRICAACA